MTTKDAMLEIDKSQNHSYEAGAFQQTLPQPDPEVSDFAVVDRNSARDRATTDDGFNRLSMISRHGFVDSIQAYRPMINEQFLNRAHRQTLS